MKHRSTRGLYDYWRRCRDIAGSVPSRADIEPAHIHGLLGDTFILECDRSDRIPFRLAGTRVCLLFNRELKGADFFDLWRSRDRETVTTAFHAMRTEAACYVIGWQGYTESDYETEGEMVLLPLTMGGSGVARALCAMAPLDLPVWLGAVPLVRLGLFDAERLDRSPDHASSPPSEPIEDISDSREQVRRVGHLSVYAGGLNDNQPH